jgi:hypothetical protein
MSGVRKIFLFIGLPLVLIFAIAVAWAFQSQYKTEGPSVDSKNAAQCEEMVSPVDVSLATSILYPGQTRGSDYKAHGGFRFDNSANGDITVKAPYDASVSAASRYLELGEVQYMIEFQTSCGLVYRFDHLQTLSPKLQTMIDQLPEAKADDSRTNPPKAAVDVIAGEVLATAVGHLSGESGHPNVFLDLGVYDKTKRNPASLDQSWAAEHEAEKEQDWYGVCWFDLLLAADATTVKTLPASGDNAKSDYCL